MNKYLAKQDGEWTTHATAKTLIPPDTDTDLDTDFDADATYFPDGSASAESRPHPLHYGTKPGHFETSKIHFPTSEVSERANE